MADLFKEIIPSILQTKKDYLVDGHDEKVYAEDAFLVNRSLSYHMDCVLYANQMNMNSHLDGKLQYQYYINTIRSMKRKFQPWQKVEKNSDLNAVKEYFGFNNEKAKQALRILNNDQITLIKEKTNKGGVTK
jgi:hypothetical protein